MTKSVHEQLSRTPVSTGEIRSQFPALSRRLAKERGVFVSHGDFYAMTVIERLGLGAEGLVRIGCACYTTEEEVERLILGVDDIVRVSRSHF